MLYRNLHKHRVRFSSLLVLQICVFSASI